MALFICHWGCSLFEYHLLHFHFTENKKKRRVFGRIPFGKNIFQSNKHVRREANTISRQTNAKTHLQEYINDVWFPLRIENHNLKPTTIAFYRHMADLIQSYFADAILQNISPLDIQRFFVFLRTECRRKNGEQLSQKTIRHLYGVLKLMFSFALQQDLITKNPMDRVEAPSLEQHRVDALSLEQANHFLDVVQTYPLEFPQHAGYSIYYRDTAWRMHGTEMA